jgi:hypothetical protein
MDSQILKDILLWTGIGLVVLFAIIGLSEGIFGDLTSKDSFLPFLVIVPVLAIVILVFRYFWKKG